MNKAELFEKVDSTWLSAKRKQELKAAVEEYTEALIAAKPRVSGSGKVCPDCGDFGIIQDEHGDNSTCPCHYR